MIDLHIYSRYSDDGEFAPAGLVERCAAKGVEIMSIADHNTARANEEARAALVPRAARLACIKTL